jgi:PhnB protein
MVLEKELGIVIEPFLFFDGCCEEAVDFYRKAMGAEIISLMRYKDSPEPDKIPAGFEEKIMYARLEVENNAFMVADDCTGHPTFQGFALGLAVFDAAAAERLFSILSERGQVLMPMAKTFWTPLFGMATDRFGVTWMISVRP